MTHESFNLLTDIVTSVLEQQAFAMVEPCADTPTIPPTASLLLSITYHGSASGQIVLLMPHTLSIELAANILGIDEDDDFAEEDAPDAMKEVLNVICGQMLTTVYGVDEIFTLSIPIHQIIAPQEWAQYQNKTHGITLLVDDAPVYVFASRLEATP